MDVTDEPGLACRRPRRSTPPRVPRHSRPGHRGARRPRRARRPGRHPSPTRSSMRRPACGSSGRHARRPGERGRRRPRPRAASRSSRRPGKNATAVAELTIAFAMIMLAPARAGGDAPRRPAASVFGRQLRGRRAGSATSSAGRHARPRRLRAGRSPGRGTPCARLRDARAGPRPVRRRCVDRKRGVVAHVDLDDLLAWSDIVSLHARAGAGNRGMIGRDRARAHESPGPTSSTPRATSSWTRTRSMPRSPRATSAVPRSTWRRPRPATGPTPCWHFRTCSSCPTSAARPTRRSPTAAAMAAAEIERFAAGEPLVNVANPAVLAAGAPPGEREPHLALDLGTGSCRAIVFDERAPRSASASASGPTGRSRGARLPGLRHGARLAAHLRLHPARRSAAAGIAANRHRRRHEHEHARGHGPLRRRRSRALGVPQRGLARRRRGRRAGPGGARAAHLRASAGDWVSITAPARFAWIRAHEPEIFARDGPRRACSATGSSTGSPGRFVTDPSCGSSSDLFDLARAVLVARVARRGRRAAGVPSPRSSSRARSWAR